MTGLIYVAIIAVWAVVLVPAWLRRHDHLDPQRSVSRFSRTMQALADRSSVLGVPLPDDQSGSGSERGRYASRSATEPAPAEVFTVSRPKRSTVATRSGAVGARVGGAAATARHQVRSTSAAARRRTVFVGLLVALVAVLVLVLTGIVTPVLLVAPIALTGGFVVASRRQLMRERTRRAAAQPARPAAPASAAASPAARRSAEGERGGTWEPRPTTLPTYVTAPPASGFPRVIDTTTPGAWTAAAMLERAQQEKLRAERMAAAKAEAIAKAKAEQAAAESHSRDDEYLTAEAAWQSRTRRRAVNE